MNKIQIGIDSISTTTLGIGFVGENEHTQVIIYWTTICNKYPNAVATMTIKSPSGQMYPKSITKDGNRIIWDVTAADCASNGKGQYQLTFTNGDEVIKTYIGTFTVLDSLVGEGAPPDPVEDWIQEASVALETFEQDIEAIDKITDATAGDVGKALSPKTVSGGNVTEWQYIDLADPEVVTEAIDAWLDDHPEATTTVEDGAITEPKLNDSLKSALAWQSDVDGLKSAFAQLYVDAPIYPTWAQGYITSSGTISTAYDSCYSELFTSNGRPVTMVAKTGRKVKVAEYAANGTFIKLIVPLSAGTNIFTIPTGELYRVQISADSGQLAPGNAPSSIDCFISVLTDATLTQAGKAADAKACGEAISDAVATVKTEVPVKNILNRFDLATITDGKYVDPNSGALVTESGFFASDYIDIGDLSTIVCSYTHIICFYDADKAYVSGQGFDTISADNSISRPATAMYMRFSTYSIHLNNAQIGANVSRANYISYGKYTLDDLIVKSNEIIVDASGGGDYTSFTEAIYDNVDNGVDIVVKPGTYNIVSEYVALFGQSAVDSMADADQSTFNGFQYGIRIRNRKVTFDSGAHLVCNWSGHTVDGTHRFSALGIGYNCEIIGLDIDCTATFYVIHDDYGLDGGIPYTVKYENCRVVGHSIYNANCIGGGCKKYSRHIINNCYFDNNNSSATVRYHNTNGSGSEPEVYVANSYFNSTLSFNYYGSQISKMRAYVNNCKASRIIKAQESSSFSVDNVELYKWCNEETDPQT